MNTESRSSYRNRPLWLIAAFLAALAIYGGYWWLQRGALDQLLGGLKTATPFSLTMEQSRIGGFPYRLDVRGTNAALAYAGDDYRLTLRADAVEIIYQPWKPELKMGFLDSPVLQLQLAQADGPALAIRAASGRYSLRRNSRGMARLALVLEQGEFAISGAAAGYMRFERLDIQARETRAIETVAPPANDDLRTHAEMLVRGEGLALAGADPVSLDASLALVARGDAPWPITRLEAWRDAPGWMKVNTLALARENSPQASFRGDAALSSDARLLLDGTLTLSGAPTGLAGVLGLTTPEPGIYRLRRSAGPVTLERLAASPTQQDSPVSPTR